MDWNIRRNYKERCELYEQYKKLSAEKETALEKLDDADDETFWKVADDYSRKMNALLNRVFYLEYPEPRNAWFKTFSESFKTGENQKISQKQAAIFMRYGEQKHEYESGRGTSYFCRVGNRGFKCQVFTEREPAYITIIEL